MDPVTVFGVDSKKKHNTGLPLITGTVRTNLAAIKILVCLYAISSQRELGVHMAANGTGLGTEGKLCHWKPRGGTNGGTLGTTLSLTGCLCPFPSLSLKLRPHGLLQGLVQEHGASEREGTLETIAFTPFGSQREKMEPREAQQLSGSHTASGRKAGPEHREASPGRDPGLGLRAHPLLESGPCQLCELQ